MYIWEVATWEIVIWENEHLESCHLGKYPWEVAAWEKAFEKVPNISLSMVTVKQYKILSIVMDFFC